VTTPPFLERQGYRKKRAMDAAHLLPLLGLVLFLLPILRDPANTPEAETDYAMIYLFSVWAGLIVLAFWLSRFLKNDIPAPRTDANTDDPITEPGGVDGRL